MMGGGAPHFHVLACSDTHCRHLPEGRALAHTGSVLCRYKVMSEHEIKLDRYAKFRNLGQVSEDLVMGGKIKEAQAERQQVG